MERKELIDALATIYIAEKENSQVYGRDESRGYYLSLGKLQGACMALKLDFIETEDCLTIFTNVKKNVVSLLKR